MTPAACSIMRLRTTWSVAQIQSGKATPHYASFSDPDGNDWVFQEITARLTGHIAPGDTSFTPELTNVVRGASASRPGIETIGGLGNLPSALALLQPKIAGETYVQ